MKKVITISREFGSGGRTIGRMAADRLGYAFYDKELIEKVAQETKLSKTFIEESGEYAPSANLFSYAFVGRGRNGQSVEDYLWSVQSKIIQELAETGNCVIVGRCADYILRERKDCLNVFVHADTEKKIERVITLYGETEKKPEKRLAEKDKLRAMNYKYYTEQVWGMAKNYHISLDSGELGIEKCVDILLQII